MGELSFLTIIVSLAVCSLLVYAIFQYMKVRLTILEQSHKEQALILQQFIEESSTDIHRLYQMKSSASHNNNDNDNAAQYGGGHHGSIILEYANADANDTSEYQEKPIAYNAPHLIHLDTAIFQNKRHTNLIEISSDSEDTTESEGSDSDSSDDESSDSESSDDEGSGSDDHTENAEPTVEPEHSIIDEVVVELVNSVSAPATAPATAPETKMITVDLGAIKESSSTSPEHQPLDVLAMLYKKSDTHEEPDVVAPASSSVAQPLTGMSVIELRNLLKEKHPEKHAEIQKMKKAELIQSLQ
jgi:hypothetical protein